MQKAKQCMKFDGVSMDDLRATDIDFHLKSGLMDNMTSMRRDGLDEMLNRIKAADEQNRDQYTGRYI